MHNCPTYPGLRQLEKNNLESSLLADFWHTSRKMVSELSGGQKQILAIVMMLQKKPSFLLLDEPTAALDPHNAQLVMQALEQMIRNGITVIMICHDRDILSTYGTNGYFELIKK